MTALRRDVAPGVPALVLGNQHIEVTVLADKGADIYSLVHRRTGVDVLFKAPWGARAPGLWPRTGTSMARWLEAYAGGWQLLLPNGGDECTERGATWGFHGEAALVPWRVLRHDPTVAELETVLFSAPLKVFREMSVDGPVFRLREVVTNTSDQEVEFMWSHHPAFGAPFLDGNCSLHVGCLTLLADDRAPGPLLVPGTRHKWPLVTTTTGEVVDMSRVPGPQERRDVLAYLTDFGSGYFAITNPRLDFGVGLRWPLEIFDKAWLWQEVRSGRDWPWFGQAYVVAVEPASTVPGQGMAAARAKGAAGVRLGPHASRDVVMESVLFEGSRAVSGIGEGGVVKFSAQ